jgi:stage II sporulation protein R
MKIKQKRLAELYIMLLCAATILNLYMPTTEATSQDPMVIPNEAIRLRILADSDSEKDQEIKRKVRDAVNAEITSWVENLVSLEEARNVIKEGIPELQKIAEDVVAEHGSNQTVKTEFNKVKFPTKLYGQYLYPAGEYEAVLITLGEGTGSNWWCVLFPPLCFLDFSNGEATSPGFDENGKVVEASTTEQVDSEEQVEGDEAATSEDKESDKQANEKAEKEENAVAEETAPLYEDQEEEQVEVKFFVVEIWNKIFG